jgi:hypothetical protein
LTIDYLSERIEENEGGHKIMMLGIRRTKAEIMRDIEHTSARVIGNNTVRYKRANGDIVIRYHLTDILTRTPNGNLILNTGGWRTYTTKARLNYHTGLNICQT